MQKKRLETNSCFDPNSPFQFANLWNRLAEVPFGNVLDTKYVTDGDACLFSRRTVGFGLPLLKAIVCRTLVVATHAGATPDFAKDGVNEILDNFNDTNATGMRLVDLLSPMAGDWKAMSNAVFCSGRKYFWDDATMKSEAALKKIVLCAS